MWVVMALIALKLGAELYLAGLNRRHVRLHAAKVPEAFREVVDAETYAKSVAYTLAKDRFGRGQMIFDTLILIGVLVGGLLPKIYEAFPDSVWAQAGFLFTVGLGLAVIGLPWDWWTQFRLE